MKDGLLALLIRAEEAGPGNPKEDLLVLVFKEDQEAKILSAPARLLMSAYLDLFDPLERWTPEEALSALFKEGSVKVLAPHFAEKFVAAYAYAQRRMQEEALLQLLDEAALIRLLDEAAKRDQN